MSRRLACGFAVWLGASMVSGAVAAETLAEAWAKAQANNANLAAAAQDVEAARAGQRASQAARWPVVEASGSYSRLDTAPSLSIESPGLSFRSPPIFSHDDFAQYSLQLRMPLYAGGAIAGGIAAADAGSDAAAANRDAAHAALRLAVAQAYSDVLAARRMAMATMLRVDNLRAHAADVQALVERELVANADLLAAKVALANAEQSRLHAQNGVSLAEAAYNRLVGEPLDRVPDLEAALSAEAALAEQPLADLLHRASLQRAELKASNAQARVLMANAAVQRARALPQLALTAGRYHLETQILDRQDFSMVGLGVSWRIFDGGQTHQAARQLRAAGKAAELRAADMRSLVELDVRRAVFDAHEAGARATASREAVAQAEEGLRMSRELFGAGLANNTQVLEAIALQAEAVSLRDRAELDQALALLRIAYAVGEL